MLLTRKQYETLEFIEGLIVIVGFLMGIWRMLEGEWSAGALLWIAAGVINNG